MKPWSCELGSAGRPAALSVSPRVGSRRRKLENDPPLNLGNGSSATEGVTSANYLRRLRDNIRADKNAGFKRRRVGMDITWLTDRIAVGGGIWTPDNMAAVSRAGITHVIDMQIEFDDTPLAAPHGIVVCWNPVDDDFEPKPPEVFARGVEFALAALEKNEAKLFVHCAAGVHRAPMMALALLGMMGWTVEDAMDLIETRRPVADFAGVYVRSVERFLNRRG
jgi:protein-tyrosine phosphatase